MTLEIIRTWYERNEKKVAVLAIISGFLLDYFTLRTVDKLAENVILFIYLIVTAVGILVLNTLDRKAPVERKRGRIHFWTEVIMQFTIGGLFSAFFVFYFRSSSFEVSFPFLLILFFGLIGSEVFKNKYSNLVFQINVFFLVLFTFLLFFIPTFFKSIALWTFLLTDIISLIVFLIFLAALKKVNKDAFYLKRKKIYLVTSLIFFIINIFYFLNLIPPLPLLVKDSGIYHLVLKQSSGSYLLRSEKESFLQKINPKNIIHIVKGNPVYVYSAIYSPLELNTDMEHLWQKFDDKNGWVSVASVRAPLIGGRADGFRMYSYYSGASEGLWRVDVRTSRGQVIGRIKFSVEEVLDNLETFDSID